MMISATTGGYSLNAVGVEHDLAETGEGPVSYDLKRANWNELVKQDGSTNKKDRTRFWQ